jgi:hypothetical protein
MTGTLVFTGPVGPGNSVTALTKTNLRKIEFDFEAQVVIITNEIGQVQSYDLHATTTHTAVVTTGVKFVETLSQ